MKVSDLVIYNNTVAVIISEGAAASSGILWHVLVEGRVMPVFEDELELASEG